jgi:hypothetical protein
METSTETKRWRTIARRCRTMFETRTSPRRKRGKRAKVANSNCQPARAWHLDRIHEMIQQHSPPTGEGQRIRRKRTERAGNGRKRETGRNMPASLLKKKKQDRRAEAGKGGEGRGGAQTERKSALGGEERRGEGPGSQGGGRNEGSMRNMDAERGNPKRETKQGEGEGEGEDPLGRGARRKGGALTCACMTSFTSDSEWMVASSLVTACLRACGRAASRPVVRGCPVRSRR